MASCSSSASPSARNSVSTVVPPSTRSLLTFLAARSASTARRSRGWPAAMTAAAWPSRSRVPGSAAPLTYTSAGPAPSGPGPAWTANSRAERSITPLPLMTTRAGLPAGLRRGHRIPAVITRTAWRALARREWPVLRARERQTAIS
jgi:hypothetical protein